MNVRLIYILLILVTSTSMLVAQSFTDDCIFIDFETIPEGELMEGMTIFDQYAEVYGVRFTLEGGGSPKLSEVGLPTTAFASQWGRDTPKPGVDIGQFFLTDDGFLDDLSATPIIVNFDYPIDSVSGCILDMDFSERFIVQARGEFGDLIFSDTIKAGNINTGEVGDEGTGDGECTPWGFRLDDCNGLIYSVILDGFRPPTAGGAFGLGLDNLSFCKFGATPNVDFVVETRELVCGATTGGITVNEIGSNVFDYSLNNGPFQDNLEIDELPAGNYTLTIRNELGCEEDVQIELRELPPLDIELNAAGNTTCGQDNGIANIDVTDNVGNVQYILNGDSIATPSIDQIVGLPPGMHQLIAIDEIGCTDFFFFEIQASIGPQWQSIDIHNAHCEEDNGELNVSAATPNPPVLISLDGNNAQTQDAVYSDLAANSYQLSAVDNDGCTLDSMILIVAEPLPVLGDIQATEPECQLQNGELIFSMQSGYAPFTYILDGQSQDSSIFQNLNSGNYELKVIDSLGCEIRAEAEVPPYICDVYVGNVFSPNSDGTNDYFPLVTYQEYQPGVLRYAIYDRWGELVFEAKDFNIHDTKYYWDGYFKGRPAVVGVYVYMVEILHTDGSRQYLSGDVTLIR